MLVSGGDFKEENFEFLLGSIKDKAYIYSWQQHSKDEINTKNSKITCGLSQFSQNMDVEPAKNEFEI